MRIYFSGISGVGVGPLAMLAQDMGHEVLGSDINVSLVSEQLEKRNILINYLQDGSFLQQQHAQTPIDMLVYTAALPSEHPELQIASSNQIKAVKRHELINLLAKEKGLKILAIAGTHGKTTTSAMLLWTMQSLGGPVSHLVGTTMTFAPIGRYQNGSEYLIYEADEFDKNFLSFVPDSSLITNIDFDHPDTYPSRQDYDLAFAQFIAQSDYVIMWDDETARFNVAKDANIDLLDSSFYDHQHRPNIIGLELVGIYNRMNATLVAEFLKRRFAVDIEKVVDVLNRYPGADRRLERITNNLYTDYAHHPSEIKAVLQMVSELNEKVVAIYQPHQNIRQKQILADGGYADAFDLASQVYWLPTYLSRETTDQQIISPSQLIETVDESYKVQLMSINEDLKIAIEGHLEAGHLVLAMSAGSLDVWVRDNFLVKN